MYLDGWNRTLEANVFNVLAIDVKLKVDRACLREMKVPFVIAAPTVKGFPPLGRAKVPHISPNLTRIA